MYAVVKLSVVKCIQRRWISVFQCLHMIAFNPDVLHIPSAAVTIMLLRDRTQKHAQNITECEVALSSAAWNFGNFVYPNLPVSLGINFVRYTKSRRSLQYGIYATGK